MNKYGIVLLCAIVTVFSSGCEGEQGKQGLSAPILYGSIQGNIYIPNKTELSGVQVKIEETSQMTLTDSLGHWRLDNIPTGIYTLEFSKDGFGTSKIMNYQVMGGGLTTVNSRPALVELPKYTVTSIELLEKPSLNDGQHFACAINFAPESPPDEHHPFRVFFSKDKNFNAKRGNYFFTVTFEVLQSVPYSSASVRLTGIIDQLKSREAVYPFSQNPQFPLNPVNPFVTGDTVYVSVCGSSSVSYLNSIYSGFVDTENSGQYVFTDITPPSNIISFVLP